MENKIKVFVKKLNENAVIPKYAHDGDVGMDLTAISVEYDAEKDMYIYHTGLAFASDFNIGDFLFLRSSNRKTEAYLCNQVGVADIAIYRGEIMICMKNRDSVNVISELNGMKKFIQSLSEFYQDTEDVMGSLKHAEHLYTLEKEEYIRRAKNLEFAPYKVGDKIAQMVCLKYPTVELVEVDELNETVRGDGGFGSTGN
jgi:dUTP pyrophosphatase